MAPSEIEIVDDLDKSSKNISVRNKLRGCRQKLAKSETDVSELNVKLKESHKRESVLRFKYNGMKDVARKERRARLSAQSQIAHLQGMLQAFQMGASSPFMNPNNLYGGSNQRASSSRAITPPYFSNVFSPMAIAPTQNFTETDSIESIKAPEFLLE